MTFEKKYTKTKQTQTTIKYSRKKMKYKRKVKSNKE
jgi:hypothetical protein